MFLDNLPLQLLVTQVNVYPLTLSVQSLLIPAGALGDVGGLPH